jgi:hypothetical protein
VPGITTNLKNAKALSNLTKEIREDEVRSLNSGDSSDNQ